MQISLTFQKFCCNLKISRLEAKRYVVFYYFNFNVVLKSTSPRILFNKNINFNKNQTDSKIENPTHSFRGTNLVL